jgi:hypothetical protein
MDLSDLDDEDEGFSELHIGYNMTFWKRVDHEAEDVMDMSCKDDRDTW